MMRQVITDAKEEIQIIREWENAKAWAEKLGVELRFIGDWVHIMRGEESLFFDSQTHALVGFLAGMYRGAELVEAKSHEEASPKDAQGQK